jgi:Zn-dependent peptidase ImmA (M78 family)/DNA-binding XRE family transcriptional regulator
MQNFNPQMLILAREVRGLSQKELADAMGIQQGTLSKIENGILDPTEHLNKIFSELDFPQSFFCRETKLFREAAHFYRKKIVIPKKEILQANARVNIFNLNVEKLLSSVEIPLENLPKWDVDIKGTPSKYAQFLREYWKIPKGRLDNLTDKLEDNGILVVHLDLGSKKLDGLSIYTEKNQAIIFVNKHLKGDRLRLTIAHEVGHLGMHFAQMVDQIRDVEKEAFEFASELLVPAVEIKPQLTRLNLEKLADLKRYWKVSMAAILKKSYEMDLITDSNYRYLWSQMRANNFHVEEPRELDVPVERPQLVKEIIDMHLNELGYTGEELSELLTLNYKDFEHFYNRSRTRVVQLQNRNL